MASRKIRSLSDEELDILEIHFYQIWGDHGISFDGNESALYDFVAQEAMTFISANPHYTGLRALVEKEFLRLARFKQ